jgi:probable HAF family extracellular repeat protein
MSMTSHHRCIRRSIPVLAGLTFSLVASSVRPAGAQVYSIEDLGTLGGRDSWATAINNAGQVVGGARTPDGRNHAFLWTNGKIQDLGTLGGRDSWANGINNLGQVVGVSDTSDGREHACLWSNGNLQDLGHLSGDRSWARGINDAGQVVGTSWMERGVEHAFLWSQGRMQDLGVLPGGDAQEWSPPSGVVPGIEG